ncbi:MAG: DUF6531 domain-containing protein, partial [Gammaproteobacteria bacterium]
MEVCSEINGSGLHRSVPHRCLPLLAGAIALLLKATLAACAAAPVTSALPLTDWDYGFNRCDVFQDGYASETAAIEQGMAAYYGVCGDQHVYSITAWGTPENPVKSLCGTKYYPTWPWDYTMGIEVHNQRHLLVEYCQGLDGMNIRRQRTAGCPEGYVASGNNCVLTGANPLKDAGPPCPRAGNPINPASGNKYLRESDYAPAAPNPIRFERHYNSNTIFAGSTQVPFAGNHWTHSYTRAISRYDNGSISTAIVRRPDGRAFYFSYDALADAWIPDADVRERLEPLPDGSGGTAGWRYTASDDSVELYDSAGRLLSITDPAGRTQALAYEPQPYDTPARLIRIDAGTGEYLALGYDSGGRLGSITDHTGRSWGYRYDDNDNLEYVDYPDGSMRRYHYEDANFPHALTGITDERGTRYADYAYDSQGRAVTSTHAGDADRVDIAYHADGTRTLTNSRGVASTYDSTVQIGRSLITGITGPGCAACGDGNTGYDYDPLTNDLRAKTVNGITTKYGNHDGNGNYGCVVKGVTAADGSTGECDYDPVASPDARRIDYTYDPRYHGRIATITEPSVYPGAYKTTTYGYDDFGNRTSVTIDGFDPDGNPVSRTTAYRYDGPLHQLSRIDGPRTDVSDITTLRYYPDDPGAGNNRARLREVEDASGTLLRSNIQYTATGKVASESRSNGLILVYGYYPGNDRLESLTESAGGQTRTTGWSYLPTGEVETITQAAGTPEATTVTFGYDAARRLTRITDGKGSYREYRLDTEGDIEEENLHDSAGVLKKSLERTFDLYNRLDTTAQANESVDYDFAPDGTLDRQIDGRGSLTDYDYDALKRLLARTRDPGGLAAQTRYEYDVADRLTTVVDAVNGTTTYRYDDLGNRLQIVSPDSGITVYTHDGAGNVTTRIQAAGTAEEVSLNYTYDALNRLTSVDAAGTADDIAYGYDNCTNGSGRRCSVTLDGTSVTYAYDPFGNITAHQQLTYGYDAAHRVETITYPSGAVLSYGYDAAGQVDRVNLTVAGNTTTLSDNLVYHPFGPVASQTFGNGLTLTRNVDTAYRQTAQTVPGALSIDYTRYDANGNLEQRTDSYTGSSEFAYDSFDRLDTVLDVYHDRDYDYDRNGNRIRRILDGDTANAVVYGYTPQSNRLASVTGWSYILDARGNTTARFDAGGAGWLYAYNAHNRLTGVTARTLIGDPLVLQDTRIANYAYNGLGQRASKTVDGETTRYRYGTDGTLLAELDENGAVEREYFYLNGRLLAVQGVETRQTGGEEVIVDNGAAGTNGSGDWSTRTHSKNYGVDYLLANRNKIPSAYRWSPVLGAG